MKPKRDPVQLSDEPEINARNEPKLPSLKYTPHGWRGRWWWWEIMCILCSVICMILLMILLVKVEKMALQAWTFGLQLNSVIAILTTVSRASMMVPIAACLGQLRWRHFAQHKDRLSSLQLFDDASRGPLGSAHVFLRLQAPALLVRGLALASVLSLGIGPTAQQILDFPLRNATLHNVTAEIGTAQTYDSKAFTVMDPIGEYHDRVDLLTLQLRTLMGAVDIPFPAQFSCPEPATTCKWDRFTTLGLCSDVRNMTDEAQATCAGDYSTGMNCTYDFPGRNHFESLVSMQYAWDFGRPIFSRFNISGQRLSNGTSRLHYAAFTAVKLNMSIHTWHTELPPKAEVFHGIWYWCAQAFRNLTILNNLPQGDGRPAETVKLWLLVDSQQGRFSEDSTNVVQLIDRDSGTVYNVSSSATGIMDYLARLFTGNISDVAMNMDLLGPLDLPPFLYIADLQAAAAGIATSITNQIRSKDTGDNLNATMAIGTATYSEVYIRIEWTWALLPLLEVFLVAELLGFTIWATRDDPQLKESVLPFLAIGLDDTIRTNWVQGGFRSAQDMQNRAHNIKIRFVKGNGVAGQVAS